MATEFCLRINIEILINIVKSVIGCICIVQVMLKVEVIEAFFLQNILEGSLTSLMILEF